MTVGHGEPLHANCAVSLRPLSSWQPQCVLRLLAEISSLLSHTSTEARVYLCRPLQLPTQHPHSLTNLFLGCHQTLPLLVLLQLELWETILLHHTA